MISPKMCSHLNESAQIAAQNTTATTSTRKSRLNETAQLAGSTLEFWQARKIVTDSTGRTMIKVRSHGSQDF
jgi:hypothetical protein